MPIAEASTQDSMPFGPPSLFVCRVEEVEPALPLRLAPFPTLRPCVGKALAAGLVKKVARLPFRSLDVRVGFLEHAHEGGKASRFLKRLEGTLLSIHVGSSVATLWITHEAFESYPGTKLRSERSASTCR